MSRHQNLSGPGVGLCSCGAKPEPGELISSWYDRHALAARELERYVMPPLGLRPRWLVAEHRLEEVQAAIKRYMEASVPVPRDWLIEQGDLLRYLSEHEMS